jgi:hypothetical protein
MSENTTPSSSTTTLPPASGATLTDLEPDGSRGRRTAVIAGLVALALVAAGLLVWRPWASDDGGKYSAADQPLRVFASVTPALGDPPPHPERPHRG